MRARALINNFRASDEDAGIYRTTAAAAAAAAAGIQVETKNVKRDVRPTAVVKI